MQQIVQFKLKGLTNNDKQNKPIKIKKINKSNEKVPDDNVPTGNKIKKRPWTQSEDLLVMKLVQQYGPHKWTSIANHLEGRIGKQCRERWHNHLNPQIKKTQWEDEEEWVLFLFHRAIVNKWAEIAKHIIGRTDNSIKNHWNSGMKRRIPDFQERLNRVQEQFSIEGSCIIERTTSDLERKALEIILLNKKYESMVSESENEEESIEVSKFKSNAKLPKDSYNSQRKNTTISKSIRKQRGTPKFREDTNHHILSTEGTEQQQKNYKMKENVSEGHSQPENEEHENQIGYHYQMVPVVSHFWEYTPVKYLNVNHQEHYQTPTGFNRGPNISSSGRIMQYNPYQENSDNEQIIPINLNFMNPFQDLQNPYSN